MSNIFELDDKGLIEKFVQGSNQLLASSNLRLEVNGAVSQLMSRTGDAIAIMYLQNKPRTIIVKNNSPFFESIELMAIDRDFVMFGASSRTGFTEYKHYVTPAGYRISYTDPAILWKKWWPTERFQDKQRFNMNILINFKGSWYPVQNINVNAGIFTIKTIAGQLVLKRDGKVLWLAQMMKEQSELAPPLESALLTDAADDRTSSSDLAKKIRQKQSEIDSEQAWKMIKELESKLKAQIQLNTELEERCNRADHRAIIAEQRLQIIYKYLQETGINPRDIYSTKTGAAS